MASLRLYTGIYVALLVLAAGKFLFFEFDQIFGYWDAFAGTIGLAVIKTALIMWFYQHLRSEPRSVSVLMLGGYFLVLLLAAAASFSITSGIYG